MNVAEAVSTRRSGTRITGPAPTDAELADLVSLAGTAPDHGRLSPWRLVVLRGEDREALGRAMAEFQQDQDRERVISKALRAPLLLTIVFSPTERPKVPRWEQQAATVCAVQTLILLLHERGWSSIWRTGAFTEAPAVRDLFGTGPKEQLLGWLYIGSQDEPRAAPRREIDGSAKLVRPRWAKQS
ncbi:nitroreductase [Streptomyces sp. NPDC047123]|uniref:nitroreductase family protein n=1 Tax=Streptomyces sp. NPDC047123 TaxID=3155622 RepID=UPI00340E671B